MLINELPGVYFKEKVTYELSGEGSKIPIFIGKTGNSANGNYKVDGSSYLKFTKISDALRAVQGTGDKWEEETGIGKYLADDGKTIINANNELSKRIYEFYQESKLLQSTDIGVPHIYVIDVGDGTIKDIWEKALETAKTLTDATVEIYVGAESISKQYKIDSNGNKTSQLENIQNFSLVDDFLTIAVDSIFEDTEELDLRYGFATVEKNANETIEQYDARLIQIGTDLRSKYSNSVMHKLSRLGLCEEFLFGKTMARICCTPYNTEPGFFVYRSVPAGIFIKRTKEAMLALQDAGIIFNRDEQVNGKKFPRINLCVSSAFGSTVDRPADSLFHARFNSDDLLREVFEACYSQIKANESATNIAYLQARVNKIVNDRVTNEEMVKYDDRTEKGTKLTVIESHEEPYNLIVTGQIQPVKCTIAIRVEAVIKI